MQGFTMTYIWGIDNFSPYQVPDYIPHYLKVLGSLVVLNQIQNLYCLLSIIPSTSSTFNKNWLWEAIHHPIHNIYRVQPAATAHCTIQYLTHSRDHHSFCWWSISLSGVLTNMVEEHYRGHSEVLGRQGICDRSTDIVLVNFTCLG